MASFDTVEFNVVPDGSFYPNPARNSEGLVEYSATIQVSTRSRRNSLMSRLSIVTWKRPLGSLSFNGRIEAGTGSAALVIPNSGGVELSYTAVLVELNDIKGYGREIVPTFQLNARFVIVGSGIL